MPARVPDTLVHRASFRELISSSPLLETESGLAYVCSCVEISSCCFSHCVERTAIAKPCPPPNFCHHALCRQPCVATDACLQPCAYVSPRDTLCNVLLGKHMSILVLNLRATTASRDSRRYTALTQATCGREIVISPGTLIILETQEAARTCTQSRIADAAAVAAKAEPPPDRIPSQFPVLPIASRGNQASRLQYC
jgi:hypothetical protein